MLAYLKQVLAATAMTFAAVACSSAQTASAVSPGSSAAFSVSATDQAERGYQLERQRVENERERTAILKATEARLAATEQPQWVKTAAAFGTPLSILVSLVVGLLGYRSQARATQQQLVTQTETIKAQFRLKAAEIAMNARSSMQVQNKAKALAALFPQELGGFGTTFDPKEFKLGQSVERRQIFIGLLAAHPAERHQIIATWALLYPTDKALWLGPLLKAESIE